MRGTRIENGKRSSMQHRRFIAPHAGSENWNMVAVMRGELEVSRSPSGERELKIAPTAFWIASFCRSPYGGAWIETVCSQGSLRRIKDRSPRGERELKFQDLCRRENTAPSLPTQGVRIEISDIALQNLFNEMSLPMRGARIEIVDAFASLNSSSSLPMRGMWIEKIINYIAIIVATMPLPTRGAWIEIPVCASVSYTRKDHSPRRERELKNGCTGLGEVWVSSLPIRGTWIEMSLDARMPKKRKSLPMRGAWIENTLDKYEIKAYQDHSPYGERELKSDNVNNTACSIWSLLTRGAWIENSI